jgi:hypothetical protein
MVIMKENKRERERGGEREREKGSFINCSTRKPPIKVSLQSSGLEHYTDKNLKAGHFLLQITETEC